MADRSIMTAADLQALADAPMTAPTMSQFSAPVERPCSWCGQVKALEYEGEGDGEHLGGAGNGSTVPICYDCWADGEWDA